jgi:N-acetyl sugar amidotransferase
MKFCKQCVNPDTRPNTEFDAHGLCPVCQSHKRNKGLVNWEGRAKDLQDILEWGRQQSKCAYDCIVGVSGGKDSLRQAFHARDELGGNPLLVSCMYPPEQLVDRGAENLSNMVAHGFDTLTISLNPQVWKQMMREAFFQFGNWCKSTELPLYALPIHASIAYKIPLVFLGENPAFTIGESHGSTDGDATRMKYSNTLAGGTPDYLMTPDVSRKDVYFYTYPTDNEMTYGKVRIVYMGHYIKDFNAWENREFSVAHGLTLRTEPIEEIGDITRSQSLDENFYMVNQMLKQMKLGFGQVTDKVAEFVNLGIMTREEGVELVKKYDGKCHDRYIKGFCNYLGITEEEFWRVAESFRNRDLWRKNDSGDWELAFNIE